MPSFKNIFYATACLALSMLFVFCGHGDVKQVIQNHFNALNQHNLDRLVKDYDNKAQVTSSGWKGIHNGPNEMRMAYARYFHSSHDIRYDVGNVYFSSDSVATVEYTMAATLTTPEAGEPL